MLHFGTTTAKNIFIIAQNTTFHRKLQCCRDMDRSGYREETTSKFHTCTFSGFQLNRLVRLCRDFFLMFDRMQVFAPSSFVISRVVLRGFFSATVSN